MNTLIIAPEGTGSRTANEVQEISISIRAVSLTGYVTRAHVLEALEQTWDVLWFATHGDPTGVSLSDEMLPISDLIALVRQAEARIVILNSCSSEAPALLLYHELERAVSVVFTVATVPDPSAYQMAALFARGLAAGLNTQEAFERARPGAGGVYRILVGEDMPSQDYTAADYRRIDDRLDRIVNDLALLRGDVSSTRHDVSSVLVRMTSLEQRMDNYQTAGKAPDAEQTKPVAMDWRIVGLFGAMALIVTAMAFYMAVVR